MKRRMRRTLRLYRNCNLDVLCYAKYAESLEMVHNNVQNITEGCSKVNLSRMAIL